MTFVVRLGKAVDKREPDTLALAFQGLFTTAVIGIPIHEGYIKSVDDILTSY